ncbi:MAG: Acyl-coenzyme A dehydrogenase [Legionellaceae bacterium]
MLGFISFISIIGILFYQRASLRVATFALFLYLLGMSFLTSTSLINLALYSTLFLLIAIPLNVFPLRRKWITTKVLTLFKSKLPPISHTEKEALVAGTLSWESELFSGNPDWEKLQNYPVNKLTEEESIFLNGPTQQVCRMIDDWDITHHRLDLPPELWQFLKEEGFFGLGIPKEYGGKNFSAYAHSAILQKLYSRSATVSSTVAVPNSLGPAELLLHYGTEEQKNYYLPRLARGEEIPCFALTSPEAGSDASAITDTGIICKGFINGEEVIGIRLNWEKRYITLAPIATVIGLAFKLYDPEHLIGAKESLGITCALIPASTKGVEIGRRHLPLNIPFQNGPIKGKDVFIPLNWIIGDAKMAGRGWQMLVECLSVGRAITLPSSAIGSAKAMALSSSAYARIRKQFHQPIGYFEGIEEALARIGGYTYLLDAGRELALSAIDKGEKPSVISAIMKYHATERGRKLAIDAMDIHGGKGICLGPHNYLGRIYQGAPIGITVEGANILTRNMIIFGQGLLRCHPYLLTEWESAQSTEPTAIKQFDHAFWGHIGFFMSNIIRSFILALTQGKIILRKSSPTKKYYQLITRYSAAFALLADAALLILGDKFKRKERLSARFADILSYLYLNSAVVKCYENKGCPSDEKLLMEWSCKTLTAKIEQAFDQILKNFPNRILAFILRGLIFPLGKRAKQPSDKLDHQLAQLLLTPSPVRDRLTAGIDTMPSEHNNIAKMEMILRDVIAAEPYYQLISMAKQSGKIKSTQFDSMIEESLHLGIISENEAEQVRKAEIGRKEVIKVDDFSSEELKK